MMPSLIFNFESVLQRFLGKMSFVQISFHVELNEMLGQYTLQWGASKHVSIVCLIFAVYCVYICHPGLII